MGLSVPVILIGASAVVLQADNLVGGAAMAGMAVLNLGCMVAVATNPRWFRPIVWLVLLALLGETVASTYFAGGIVNSGFQPLWLLIAPLSGTLVLGPRDGFVFTLLALAGLISSWVHSSPRVGS